MSDRGSPTVRSSSSTDSWPITIRPSVARQAARAKLTRLRMCDEMPNDEAVSRVVIAVEGSNLRSNHLYLAKHVRSGFFPQDAVGEQNATHGKGKDLTVWFAGSDTPVHTDIAGGHKFFRERTPQREFFERHRIRAGDQVAIEWLGGREYRVLPVTREQLVWTREEIILAMDFYVRVGAHTGGPIPGQTTAQIVELSGLLKKLGAYPPERQD